MFAVLYRWKLKPERGLEVADFERMTVKRFVVGTDFSAPAEHAVDVAVSLGRALDAEITLVHAYEVPVLGFRRPRSSLPRTSGARFTRWRRLGSRQA